MMIIQRQNDIKETLKNIVSDRVFRTACLDTIALITERIQNKGQNSKGSSIGTYSKSGAKFRSKSGRQTSKIDLTFTGQMINSLDFERTGEIEYSIGFADKIAADKAEWNEARFGEVFALTDQEVKLIGESLENNIGEATRG